MAEMSKTQRICLRHNGWLYKKDNPFELDRTDYPNGKFKDLTKVRIKIKDNIESEVQE